MKKLIALCAAALVTAAVYAAHYPEIQINELKSAMSSKQVTILDVNGSDSYN